MKLSVPGSFDEDECVVSLNAVLALMSVFDVPVDPKVMEPVDHVRWLKRNYKKIDNGVLGNPLKQCLPTLVNPEKLIQNGTVIVPDAWSALLKAYHELSASKGSVYYDHKTSPAMYGEYFDVANIRTTQRFVVPEDFEEAVEAFYASMEERPLPEKTRNEFWETYMNRSTEDGCWPFATSDDQAACQTADELFSHEQFAKFVIFTLMSERRKFQKHVREHMVEFDRTGLNAMEESRFDGRIATDMELKWLADNQRKADEEAALNIRNMSNCLKLVFATANLLKHESSLALDFATLATVSTQYDLYRDELLQLQKELSLVDVSKYKMERKLRRIHMRLEQLIVKAKQDAWIGNKKIVTTKVDTERDRAKKAMRCIREPMLVTLERQRRAEEEQARGQVVLTPEEIDQIVLTLEDMDELVRRENARLDVLLAGRWAYPLATERANVREKLATESKDRLNELIETMLFPRVSIDDIPNVLFDHLPVVDISQDRTVSLKNVLNVLAWYGDYKGYESISVPTSTS